MKEFLTPYPLPRSGSAIVPFMDNFPKNRLYQLMTTKLSEANAGSISFPVICMPGTPNHVVIYHPYSLHKCVDDG